MTRHPQHHVANRPNLTADGHAAAFGTEPAETLEGPPVILEAPGNASMHRAQLKAASVASQAAAVDLEGRRAGHRVFWISVTANALFSDDNQAAPADDGHWNYQRRANGKFTGGPSDDYYGRK